MNSKIRSLIVDLNTTLIQALEKMDKIGFKLLMIADTDDHLLGLITIGDIQRAIIANVPLQSTAIDFIRTDLYVARNKDSNDYIKKQMLQFRLVYMPVLDDKNTIVDVIFWDDIIGEDIKLNQADIDLPVIIMAGGRGTRLKPLTNVLPKPLLPFGDKTIIEVIMDRFGNCGCKNFFISVNYKAELIKFYFNNIKSKAYSVEFFSEERPLGTVGSLSLLKNKLDKPFFISNCDILIDQDYTEIYQYHRQHSNELTLVASLKQYHIPYGIVESGYNGELLSIKEKPDFNFMASCGMYILEPHLLEEIPENGFFHITDLIHKVKNRKGKVGVFPVSEKSWTDIGEWQYYSKSLYK